MRIRVLKGLLSDQGVNLVQFIINVFVGIKYKFTAEIVDIFSKTTLVVHR